MIGAGAAGASELAALRCSLAEVERPEVTGEIVVFCVKQRDIANVHSPLSAECHPAVLSSASKPACVEQSPRPHLKPSLSLDDVVQDQS